MAKKPTKPQPGPDPDRLKITDEDWQDAVDRALRKPRPEDGWPKREPPPKGQDDKDTDPPKPKD